MLACMFTPDFSKPALCHSDLVPLLSRFRFFVRCIITQTPAHRSLDGSQLLIKHGATEANKQVTVFLVGQQHLRGLPWQAAPLYGPLEQASWT